MGRRTLVLIIAVALAAISGFAIYQYLTNVEDDIRADIAEVVVYRANAPIAVGYRRRRSSGIHRGDDSAPRECRRSKGRRSSVREPLATMPTAIPSGSWLPEQPERPQCRTRRQDRSWPDRRGPSSSRPAHSPTSVTCSSGCRMPSHPGKVAISLECRRRQRQRRLHSPWRQCEHPRIGQLVAPLAFLEIISNDELRDLLIEIEPVSRFLKPIAEDGDGHVC